LFKEYPEKQEEEFVDLSKLSNKGFKIYDASKVRQHLPPARSVIDLHIEKLTDNYEKLSNLEIIGIQLAEFEKWFDLAIAHRQPSLIVIHGVGKGRLREEIHDILKTKKEVKHFINQYDPRFGYGATEVFFQY
jgi:dsDNA-specific endonuclease/ATPase MutS2